MKKIFISLPMNGRTDEEILDHMGKIKNHLSEVLDEPFMVLDTFIHEEAPKDANVGLWYLSKSLELLAQADIMYKAANTDNARGCIIEEMCANSYGIKVIKESEENK